MSYFAAYKKLDVLSKPSWRVFISQAERCSEFNFSRTILAHSLVVSMSLISGRLWRCTSVSRVARRTNSVLPVVALLLFGGLLAGCGKNTGEAASLKGSIKFDGEPIVKGVFRLSSEDGTPGPGGLSPIQNGQYEIPAAKGLKAGKYLVLIYGFKETGRTIKADENATSRQEEQQFIPRRYNDDSQQRIELLAGENIQDFDLQK